MLHTQNDFAVFKALIRNYTAFPLSVLCIYMRIFCTVSQWLKRIDI